ncbi:MAG: membrane protein [Alphaproteobacteria bacterium]|nr:MAG: membrane protein [Alphaproteobacteria bacterium]
MTAYFVLKYLHVIGAAVLLGTGAGIAFFMLMAHRTGDPVVVAGVARIVVIADFLFTATAVVAQPITGVALAWEVGYALTEGWILLSILLYIVTGAFWLPVVWMQARMRRLAAKAADRQEPLPPAYHRLFRTWFAFGFPAFGAVAAIFWLMIARPSLGLPWGV